jgi:hypothetical protein
MPFWLSTTACSIYSQLHSIPGSPFFHPQPEDAQSTFSSVLVVGWGSSESAPCRAPQAVIWPLPYPSWNTLTTCGWNLMTLRLCSVASYELHSPFRYFERIKPLKQILFLIAKTCWINSYYLKCWTLNFSGEWKSWKSFLYNESKIRILI